MSDCNWQPLIHNGPCYSCLALQCLTASVTLCAHPSAFLALAPSYGFCISDVATWVTGVASAGCCGLAVFNKNKTQGCHVSEVGEFRGGEYRGGCHGCAYYACCALSFAGSVATCVNPLAMPALAAKYLAAATGTNAAFCCALGCLDMKETINTKPVTRQPLSLESVIGPLPRAPPPVTRQPVANAAMVRRQQQTISRPPAGAAASRGRQLDDGLFNVGTAWESRSSRGARQQEPFSPSSTLTIRLDDAQLQIMQQLARQLVAAAGQPVSTVVANVAQDGGEANCVVCFERPRNAFLRPCGHVQLCMPCVEILRVSENRAKCPTCRAEIEEVYEAFV